MYLDSAPLGLFSLIVILACLVVILVCNHVMRKKQKKTLDHIDFVLDQESEEA